MRVFIWGYGSIGRRHLENSLRNKGVDFLGLITRKPKLVLDEKFKDVRVYDSIESIEADPQDFLVIATATAVHLKCLNAALDKGFKRIYLEKPIAHAWEGIQQVSKKILEKGAHVLVGYDLRFDDGLIKAKEMISEGLIGRVCSFHAHVGQYLPDWRPHEDYREGMSASKKLGGGVMLDLIHELDYLIYLFGEPIHIINANGQLSDLEIETEDVSDSLITFRRGFSGTLHQDYLQKELSRYIHIVGSKGTLHLDFANKSIRLIDLASQEFTFDYTSQDRNDRFINALEEFFHLNPKHTLCSWEDGTKSLYWILKAKESNVHEQINFT